MHIIDIIPFKFNSCTQTFDNLGAQLKTMHNARLLTSQSLTDLCRPPVLFEDDASATRRLQMNLTLYGRNLSGLVLLVGRDPMFHINERTGIFVLFRISLDLICIFQIIYVGSNLSAVLLF